MLESVPCPDADFLKSVQSDVHSESCRRLRVLLSRRLEECGAPGLGRGVARMLRALAEWDGRYRARSRGAAAFQLIIHAFALPWLERGYGRTLTAWLLASEAFTRVLEEELAADRGPALREELLRGAREAYRRWRRTPAWGLLHRLRPAHPFRMLPGIGRFFVFGDAGADGSSQTVMKSAHPVTGRPHAVTYAAVARHVADLSDPDANEFALLGGQDGWLLSENSLDLWEEWKQGRYVRVPLREESVREAFPHVVELEPGKTAAF